MTLETDPGSEKRDYSISLVRANLIVTLLSLPMAAVMYMFFLFLATPVPISPPATAGRLMLFLALLIAGITLHEVLHAIGWIIAGRLPVSSVSFGFKLRTLSPYAHLREAVPARIYRAGILLPFIVLGLLPYIVGILLANQLVMIYGLFFTLAAGGDLLALWLLRGVPGDVLVEDHPTRAGCRVYEPSQST